MLEIIFGVLIGTLVTQVLFLIFYDIEPKRRGDYWDWKCHKCDFKIRLRPFREELILRAKADHVSKFH